MSALPFRCRHLLSGLLLATLAALAPARVVHVGVYANEPKIFLNAEGRATGVFADLLTAIAEAEGWQLRWQRCEWQACLEALEAGQLDLMPDVAYTAERARRFDFHQRPVMHSWSQVYRHPQVPIQSVLDLQGKRVAVLEGSVQAGLFRELAASFGVQVQLVPVATLDQAFEQVAARRADAAIANHFFGSRQAQRHRLAETAIVFQPSRLYYAATRGRHSELLAAIDRHLGRWQDDPRSIYYALIRQWGGQAPEPQVPRQLWWALAALAGALALLLAVAGLLRRQVRLRTGALQQALEEVARFKSLFDQSQLSAWIAQLDGRLVYVNAWTARLRGLSETELIGQRYLTLYADEGLDQAQAYWRGVADGRAMGEAELLQRAEDGRARPMLTSGLLLRDAQGQPQWLACTALDLSERKRAEEQIHQLAFYDGLSGLPNRRLLLDHLQHALAASARHGSCGALLYIDLDHFKTVNDTLGHEYGDMLLREVAARLRTCVRVGDTVARLGGDEFIVLLEDLDLTPAVAAAQAEGVGRKILAALGRPYRLAGHELYTTPSIGVVLFGQGSRQPDELLKQADLAMYQAKAAGRNALRFFDPQMQTAVSERAALLADLRQALAAQQLQVHWQPQVLEDGRISGAEALLRWQHPARGAVSPAQFIPIAEDSGLIHEIGLWVLQQACAQQRAWAADPALAALVLSVNVSVQQFRHPDFVPRVLQILRDSGADASRLKLEITESLLMQDVEEVVSRMAALRHAGLGFALDDFGTGYSSLAYLKRLPLQQLKIDASFVRDLLTDPNDAAIVQTIIALAQALELQVVAEGVETEAQRAALAAQGCRAYQGFLYSRAVPAEDLQRLVRAGPLRPAPAGTAG